MRYKQEIEKLKRFILELEFPIDQICSALIMSINNEMNYLEWHSKNGIEPRYKDVAYMIHSISKLSHDVRKDKILKVVKELEEFENLSLNEKLREYAGKLISIVNGIKSCVNEYGESWNYYTDRKFNERHTKLKEIREKVEELENIFKEIRTKICGKKAKIRRKQKIKIRLR